MTDAAPPAASSAGHVHASPGLHGSRGRTYKRWDIQALRGIAVLLVVFQHARFPFVAGGFLGVDIFFVISGFLMGGIIAEGIDARRFTFAGFYARRARRLFPAAYATIIVTALLAPFFLDGFEITDFARQAAGAFTFTINFVLWKQINYFNSGAMLKPLLHLWSLAVEEQYYVFLPLMLVALKARHRVAATMALTGVSFLLCAYVLPHSPSAAFYFLPTRAWELGLGTVAALALRRYRFSLPSQAIVRGACWTALLVIPVLCAEAGHPGLPALAVCIATMLLLVTRPPPRAPSALAPLTATGDRSYTLYLVHWPVYAFANNVFIEPPSLAVNAALLLVILAWMELQYRLVEQPLRHFAITRRAIAVLLVLPLLTCGASWGVARQAGQKDLAWRAGNRGFGEACNYQRSFDPRPACQNGDHPRTLVWGDSFAMHLVGGVAATAPGGVMQATKQVCGPFAGMAPLDGIQHRRGWAEDCMAFNRSVLEALARRDDIRTVVLSSVLVQYIPGAEPEIPWRILRQDGAQTRESALDSAALLQSLEQTVRALHATGKKVVLVAPPPSIGVDTARCVDRAATGLWTISELSGCNFSRANYEEKRDPVLKFLASARHVVPVISFDALLCGRELCRTAYDSVPIYRDDSHFSIPGGVLVAKKIKLGTLIEAAAR